jgi:hypothetical protein
LEIRQNTVAVQTNALQQHFEQHTGLVMTRVNNPALRDVYARASNGTGELTAEDNEIFAPYIISFIRNHFVAHELRKSGLLPEVQWKTFRASLVGTMRHSASRDIWRTYLQRYPGVYPADFVEAVEKAIVDSE